MTFFESEAGTDRTRERKLREVQQGAGRSGRMALASAIVAVGTVILVLAYSAYQVTAPARTQVILERGVASVTDIDAYLAENMDDLREQAGEVEAGASVLPPLFPLPISLSAEEVRQSSDLEIRNLLLARAADAVQEDGLRAFDQSGSQDFGLLSIEGAVDNMIGLLTGSSHSQAGVVTVAAALVVAIAGAIIAASDFRPGVIKTIGGAIAAGAFGGFLFSAALVFIFSRAGGDPLHLRDRRHRDGHLRSAPPELLHRHHLWCVALHRRSRLQLPGAPRGTRSLLAGHRLPAW
ncbi:MAG: hypothetical protein U5Q44_01940 [Dehalococcoidia bacterium]|nr:hypothetical protein [Dehalococcoidia bacterium]